MFGALNMLQIPFDIRSSLLSFFLSSINTHLQLVETNTNDTPLHNLQQYFHSHSTPYEYPNSVPGESTLTAIPWHCIVLASPDYTSYMLSYYYFPY